jgi:hypothetical protein
MVIGIGLMMLGIALQLAAWGFYRRPGIELWTPTAICPSKSSPIATKTLSVTNSHFMPPSIAARR